MQKGDLTDEQQRLVDGMEAALLKLDAKTERLRAYLLSIFGEEDDLEAVPPA